jgi:hypothetical protein
MQMFREKNSRTSAKKRYGRYFYKFSTPLKENAVESSIQKVEISHLNIITPRLLQGNHSTN